MSNSRRSSVRSYAVTHPAGRVSLPTQPGWDRVVYAHAGSFTATSQSTAWTVPIHRAACIPDGHDLLVDTTVRVSIRCLYLRIELASIGSQNRVVTLSPLARALLVRAVTAAPMTLETEVDQALITLLADELRGDPGVPLDLPLPVEPTARRLADEIMADPSAGLGVQVEAVGVGRRTMERRFRIETGLSLGRWHRRARILRSIALLASGATVTETALQVGYSSPSSFIAGFRSEVATSPKAFVRAGRRPG